MAAVRRAAYELEHLHPTYARAWDMLLLTHKPDMFKDYYRATLFACLPFDGLIRVRQALAMPDTEESVRRRFERTSTSSRLSSSSTRVALVAEPHVSLTVHSACDGDHDYLDIRTDATDDSGIVRVTNHPLTFDLLHRAVTFAVEHHRDTVHLCWYSWVHPNSEQRAPTVALLEAEPERNLWELLKTNVLLLPPSLIAVTQV